MHIGEQAIGKLFHEFYDRVLDDPELQPFFKNTSMDKLRWMQREFFSATLDGPITYTNRPLCHVHHGRDTSKHHFALYVDHLIDTLQDYGITDQDVQDIIGRINTYADEITGDVGSVGYRLIHLEMWYREFRGGNDLFAPFSSGI